MIAFIIICYSALYVLIFSKLKLLKNSVSNIAAFIGLGVVLIAATVFSWYTYSPITPDARMVRYVIPVVPNVKGRVVSVDIEAMVPVKEGQTLFTIDPTPYQFAVSQLEAQIQQYQAQERLAEANYARAKTLLETQAAAQVDVDRWLAELDVARAAIKVSSAQLDDANWRLEETVVKAPYNGYVPNLQLRTGHYVTTIPVTSPMAFISNEMSDVVASFSQSAMRRVQAGDPVELTFATFPGEVFSGRVSVLGRFSAQAQYTASSNLPAMSGAPASDRWMVRVELDDIVKAQAIPQGAGATMAVYTQSGKPVHIISRVAIRMNAWLSYLTAP
ncbi:efflux RND transporter periplasmic adaptor subunit [Agaribacterium sp. ZY112]|uniref:efflux RND transporter periplasmic adaptor subunit n=1 Tax=Agaribacterium sp. ZY112 TaxID=3233574 RepID=UPI00352575FF